MTRQDLIAAPVALMKMVDYEGQSLSNPSNEFGPQTDKEFLAADAYVRDVVGKIGELWLGLGLELHKIRLGGAYTRHGYASFPEYIQSIRVVSPAHARRLLFAAEMVQEALGQPLPSRGGPGRPKKAPAFSNEPEEQPETNAPVGAFVEAEPEEGRRPVGHLPETPSIPPTVTERALRETHRRVGRAGTVTRLRQHLADPSIPLIPPGVVAAAKRVQKAEQATALGSWLTVCEGFLPSLMAEGVPDEDVPAMLERLAHARAWLEEVAVLLGERQAARA